MSLAYSVISSEHPYLIEFTAAYLCPNVHKKHSQNHRIANENRGKATQQLHVLLRAKKPLLRTSIPFFLFSQHFPAWL